MRRLPLVVFGALIAATVAAFFVTQHLKVSTPLVAGFPRPAPAMINPEGGTCQGVNHRRMFISFYLLHRTDDVDVFVVDQDGSIVATLATNRHMRRSVRTPDGLFYWNGREDNGSVAPDGKYYIRIALLGQGRTVELTKTPVTVKTIPPRPVVTSVSPSLMPDGTTPVTIHYRGNEHRPATVLLYRTDVPGRLRLVDSFGIVPTKPATWNGLIDGRPAPAGIYLVGLSVTDAACNTGRFPITIPPAPGTTRHAGVTVRYVAAQPPLDPVPAGSRALVYVDARNHAYRWALRRAGVKKPAVTGSQSAGDYALHVRLPRSGGPGLYKLAIRSGAYRTVVPVVASAESGRRSVLVVLPALTWQGFNPSDDNGDGLPDTLPAGAPIKLARPFLYGLPPGFGDEEGFLTDLDKGHLSYDLTTDLALINGTSTFSGHAAVALAGSEVWLPESIRAGLRTYVEGGGHVISLGTDSLRRGVTVAGGQASDPTPPAAIDALGARPGPIQSRNQQLILVIHDGLRIFTTTSGAFPGYSTYQPIVGVTAPGQIASDAGTSASSAAIVGYRLGKGVVVDVGLVGFGSSLAHNVDAKEFVSRLWSVLGR